MSIETIQALLYRTGIVGRRGCVLVTFDPFAFWAEACGSMGLPCIFYVAREPPEFVENKVAELIEKHKRVPA